MLLFVNFIVDIVILSVVKFKSIHHHQFVVFIINPNNIVGVFIKGLVCKLINKITDQVSAPCVIVQTHINAIKNNSISAGVYIHRIT